MLIALSLLAVLIPTTLGALILSNTLSSTFTVSDQPFVVSWVGTDPNTATMIKNNEYVYNVSVQNVSPNAYTKVRLEVKIFPPSPITSSDQSSPSSPIFILQRDPLVNPASGPTTLGSVLTYIMFLPSDIGFNEPMNPGQTAHIGIGLTFRDSAPVGQYRIQVSVVQL